MKATEIKEFYNNHFFQDGHPVGVFCRLTIGVGEQEVQIPGIELHPGHTIDQVFRTLYAFLQEGGELPPPVTTEEVKSPPPPPELVDIEIIDYKGKAYLVDALPAGEYVVRNQETNNIISNQSPTAKAVIKRYEELQSPQD